MTSAVGQGCGTVSRIDKAGSISYAMLAATLSALLVPSGTMAMYPTGRLIQPTGIPHSTTVRGSSIGPATPLTGRTIPWSQRLAQPNPRCAVRLTAIDPIDIQILQQQLQAVRNLPRITEGAVSDEVDASCRQPSYRRLFNHATWRRYTAQSMHRRWWNVIRSWPGSSITRAILPCVAAVFVWAVGVACAMPLLVPSIARKSAQMWIPLSLQGTAIGLLLVFRTNNAYLRLAEAREQWGKLLMLVRELATKTSAALPYDVTCEACRYLCAFVWSLRDKLRDGDQRDDILNTLLGNEEAGWVAEQRSRPLAILSRLRRLIYGEYSSGSLDSQVYYFLETDLKEVRRPLISPPTDLTAH